MCLLFRSSRSLLNVSCVFSILFPRFWIILISFLWILFSGRLPISSSFVWSGGFLPCFFICCLFLCLLILLNLVCLGSSFRRLQVCSSCCILCLPPVGCIGFLWRGLVPVFWWMRLVLVFLVRRTVSDSVFWGVCELSMILGSLSADGWGCVPVLLIVWHRVSSTVACWLLSGAGS